MEKSHVALSICPICHEDVGVLLSTRIQNGKLKEIFEDRRVVDPTHVCYKCQEKYLKEGIMIIDPHTGSLAVIKESCFRENFDIPVPDTRIAFMEDSLMRQIGLME